MVVSLRGSVHDARRGIARFRLGADDRAVFRVAGTTGIQEVDLRTVSHPFNMGYNFGPPPDSDWLDSRQTPAAPLYQQRQDEYYWYVYTPKKSYTFT